MKDNNYIKILCKIADEITPLLNKDKQNVIETYKQCLHDEMLDSARIISDELSDRYTAYNDPLTVLVNKLYQKTMEYYEVIN